MPTCIACQQATDKDQTFIEVLTLHMRGMAGDKRAQALGEKVEAPLCDACLDVYIAKQADVKGAVTRQALLFGGLSLLGIALLALPLKLPMQMSIFGAAFILVGALGLVKGVKDARDRAAKVASDSVENNRARFLPQAVAPHLPRKAGENDISYVRWEEGLCDQRLGDLAVRHQLLPLIAQQLRDQAREAFRPEADSPKT